MVIKLLLYALILITAFPAGYFLAWLCKEELVDGRKWFKIINYCLFVILISLLIFYRNISIIFTVIYMIIVVFVSLLEGKNKKFVGN